MLNNLLLQSLCSQDPIEKCTLTFSLYENWLENKQYFAMQLPKRPGFPENLQWVSPKNLPKRSLVTLEGRAAMLHALAHIEFNAINLALDAVARFTDMPIAFYQDWLKVAYEEAQHFQLLNNYLQTLGYQYGDFPVHNGLWEVAENTEQDVLLRMALVPRVMEARGLDVTPGIINKLKQVKDKEAIAILEIIHKEEIGHVTIGSHWFFYLCQQRNLPPQKTFIDLIKTHLPTMKHGPFAMDTRLQAGFNQAELEDLLKLN